MSDIFLVDLSRFTCLTVLRLRHDYGDPALHEQLASLGAILASISSCQLQELYVDYQELFIGQTLNSILAGLDSLENINAILSRSQFCHLNYVEVDFKLHIFAQDQSVRSETLPVSLSSDVCGSDSSSYSGLSANVYLDNPDTSFGHYAEHRIRNKIQEKLKPFSSRGILEIKLSLEEAERDPKISDILSDAGISRNADDSTTHPIIPNTDSTSQ